MLSQGRLRSTAPTLGILQLGNGYCCTQLADCRKTGPLARQFDSSAQEPKLFLTMLKLLPAGEALAWTVPILFTE